MGPDHEDPSDDAARRRANRDRVAEYLTRHFGAPPDDLGDQDGLLACFRVTDGGRRCGLVVHRPFLDDLSAGRVTALLDSWDVADRMRRTGPGVVVHLRGQREFLEAPPPPRLTGLSDAT